jgi:hypothetical protein
MTEREKPDLSAIEPIGKAPDAHDEAPRQDRADEHVPATEPEPRTSPETEDKLEQLRRG